MTDDLYLNTLRTGSGSGPGQEEFFANDEASMDDINSVIVYTFTIVVLYMTIVSMTQTGDALAGPRTAGASRDNNERHVRMRWHRDCLCQKNPSGADSIWQSFVTIFGSVLDLRLLDAALPKGCRAP